MEFDLQLAGRSHVTCQWLLAAGSLKVSSTARSNSDLKQCMPVRNFVRLEAAPTPRDCHVRHRSTTIAIREQPADLAAAVSSKWLQEL
ncbi:hypothetical protein M9458_053990 [Cirrhinus mrigala]|uniref:Uncharacterized protein n=1 Tax=Cirrhinus mrigala TaxID=683832 RepID=A0ABD0MP26_CIRMR